MVTRSTDCYQQRESLENLKEALKDEEDLFLKRVITVDEIWIHHFQPESEQQSLVWKQLLRQKVQNSHVYRKVDDDNIPR